MRNNIKFKDFLIFTFLSFIPLIIIFNIFLIGCSRSEIRESEKIIEEVVEEYIEKDLEGKQ